MVNNKNYNRFLRPKNLSEFIGQDIPIKIINNAIKNNVMFSTYLFAGQYGTGKTSLARVFCKTINCLNPSYIKNLKICCSECTNCNIINTNSTTDYIELDAASNRTIDNIRNIIETTKFAPLQLKHKFIVIDEAHCLTSESFKALLKTLEEANEKIMIILVTTELTSISNIVLSRCQIIYFSSISSDNIEKYLIKFYKEEIFQNASLHNDDAAELIKSISIYSNNSMRTAINMFEMGFNLKIYNDIDIFEIYKILNIYSYKIINKTIENIINNKNINECKDYFVDNNKYKNTTTWNIITNNIILELDKYNINDKKYKDIFTIISIIRQELSDLNTLNDKIINIIIFNRIIEYYRNEN